MADFTTGGNNAGLLSSSGSLTSLSSAVQATVSNPANIKDLLNPSPSSTASLSIDLSNWLRANAPNGTKWNKIFPYVLRIGSFSGNGTSTTSQNVQNILQNGLSSLTGNTAKGASNPATANSIISGNLTNTSITLPIAPQNISISTPAASNLTVTLKGIVEEHNGAPLRNIRISGTTGVFPGKNPGYFTQAASTGAASPFSVSAIAQDLFSNTLSALNQLENTVTGAGSGLAQTSLMTGVSTATDQGINNTGYFLFHQLVNFFDQYLAAKKVRSNKDLYLVFEMQKDDLFYRCSLRNFSFSKRPGTLEYDYTIDLTGWGYEAPSSTTVPSTSSTASLLSSISATIQQARAVLSGVRAVVSGINQDADRLFLIAGEVGTLTAEAIGTAQTVTNLPAQIKQQFQSIVTNSWTVVQNAVQALASSSNSGTTNAIQKLAQASTISNSTQAGPNTPIPSAATVLVGDIFQNPNNYVDFFDQIPLNILTIPAPLQTTINNETNRVLNLTSAEWMERRDYVVAFSNAFSNAIGAYSNTYNAIQGIAPNTSLMEQPTLQELDVMRALGDMITSLNGVIVTNLNLDQTVQNYVDFYVNVAQANGIALVTPTSKIAVPVPLGATLQTIAQQYLNDSSRWMELAAINQLRSPFIDETGFFYSIVGETNGNQITVNSNQDLYINQPIMLTAKGLPQLNARIKQIEVINTVTVLLTLDTTATGYGQSAAAQMQAYLPGTINSNMLIYVPSASAPTVLAQDFKFAPDINDQTVLAAIAGTDILLNSEGDIAVTSTGDVKVASGVANLLQAATLVLETPLGSLIQYPSYGLGVLPGTAFSDYDINAGFKQIQAAFASDDRFSGVLASRIFKIGPISKIDIALALPNTNAILPLSVNLRQ